MSQGTIPAEVRYTQGSCLCGKIAFEFTGEPFGSAMCHCVNCRKTSGSAFLWNVFLSRDQFHLTSGEDTIKEYEDSDTDSGNTFVRSFCSNCGSSLFGVRRDKPEVIILMTGCIKDTPAEWSPGMAIYCKYRAKWLPDVEGVEYFEV